MPVILFQVLVLIVFGSGAIIHARRARRRAKAIVRWSSLRPFKANRRFSD